MVQYGFPVPPALPLERPLCDPDALVRDGIAAERAAAAAVAAEARQPEVGGETDGRGGARDLPTGAEGEERQDTGDSEEWGGERVRLMNELFTRAQQRFAREAGSDERQFEMRVSLWSCARGSGRVLRGVWFCPWNGEEGISAGRACLYMMDRTLLQTFFMVFRSHCCDRSYIKSKSSLLPNQNPPWISTQWTQKCPLFVVYVFLEAQRLALC